MIAAAVVGATGYTGREIIRLLLGHPEVELCGIAADPSFHGQKIQDVFPRFDKQADLTIEDAQGPSIQKAECIFFSLPHTVSMEIIQAYADSGKKLIDLSADLRFDDLAAYEKCYGVKHIDQALNGKFIYGLPEINRSQVQKTNFLANPGCYPTSVILAIAPVLKNGLIEPTGIICDSKTGVTGAGRKAALGFLFPEVSETLKAYKVDQHPHAPEIDQELTKLAGTAARVTFVPHLVPLNRGILSTIYCRLAKPVSTGQVLKVYQEMYGAEPFVRVKGEGQYPEVQEVLHSNYCDIGLKVDQTGETLMVVSVIDNLLKGASGQAVQNMNIMCGFKETAGLL